MPRVGDRMAQRTPDRSVRRQQLEEREPRAFLWLFSLGWILLLGIGVASNPSPIQQHLAELLPWIGLLMVVQAFPLDTWLSTKFTADQPITIAMALVLDPVEAGLVAFLAALDPREIHRQVSM